MSTTKTCIVCALTFICIEQPIHSFSANQLFQQSTQIAALIAGRAHQHAGMIFGTALCITGIILIKKMSNAQVEINQKLSSLQEEHTQYKELVDSLSESVIHVSSCIPTKSCTLNDEDEKWEEAQNVLNQLNKHLSNLESKLIAMEQASQTTHTEKQTTRCKDNEHFKKTIEELCKENENAHKLFLQLHDNYEALRQYQKSVDTQIKTLQEDTRIDELQDEITLLMQHTFAIENALDRFVVGRGWRKILNN